MVYIANELLGTLQFVLLFYVLFKDQITFHRQRILALTACYVFGVIVMILLHQEENVLVVGTVFQIAAVWLLLIENIWGKLLSFLLIFSLPDMFSLSFEIILRFFVKENVLDGFFDLEYGLGGKTLCLLVVLGMFAYRRRNTERFFISDMTKFLMSFIIDLFLIVLGWMTRNHGHVDSMTAVLMACCSIVIAMLCIWLMVVDSSRRTNSYRLEVANQRYAYAKEFERNQKEIRKIHHDLNKHIQIIGLYAEQGRTDKIEEYVQELNEDLTSNYIDAGYTENTLFNGILTDRIAKAAAKNIAITHKGDLREKLAISDYDFCLIIMNLLDNALEYVEKKNLHEVKVQTYQDDHTLMLKVINPLAVGEDVDISKSSKENQVIHGFGLEIVRRAAERNHGSLEITTEDNQFAARVIIHM